MSSYLRRIFIGDLNWKRLIRSLILIPIAVVFGLLIIALFFADRAIFRPPTASYRDSAEIIKISVPGGERISAKYYQNPQAKYTLLFSHGNAEDIGAIEPFVWRLRDLGLNVLTYDYRGYGTSEGSPSENNAYDDITAAYDYLIKETGTTPNRIILHGRSLGGGAAVDLASRREVGGLILESTFTSAFRVVTRVPVLPFDKFNNISKIQRVHCPVLVIHGTEDRTIPDYHGKELIKAANEPKYSLWVTAGHNDVIYKERDRYLESLLKFVQSLEAK